MRHKILVIFFCLRFLFVFCEQLSPLVRPELKTCRRTEWQCGSGECIYVVRRCDSEPDCKDGSDEDLKSCNEYTCHSRTHFLCKNGVECIKKEMSCDGSYDCFDDSDELGCSDCTSEEFKCENNLCIPKKSVCDGYIDCHADPNCVGQNCSKGGEDEKNCKEEYCRHEHKKCKNGECIHISFFCDGVNDCFDGDDENKEKCGSPECLLEEGHFKCVNTEQCLDKKLLCNGENDCGDRSDEGGHCDMKCRDEYCPQECFQSPLGPSCMCKSGYLAKGSECKEIDECAGNVSVCDHYCLNTEGSYTCHCLGEYTLQKDGKTCKIGKPALLLISSGTEIKASLLSHSIIPEDDVGPTRKERSWIAWKGNLKTSGLAYDPETNKVYFIAGNKYVYRTDLDEEQNIPEVVVYQGLGKAENLALDWFSRNLYITDYKKSHILVCSLETEACVPILSNLSQPRSISLDLENGHMYFTDVKSHSISRAKLDGSDFRVIIEKNLTWPNGLVLDHPAKRMYWVDAYLDTVESSDFDGKNRKNLPSSEVYHPFSITLWEDRLYWTEWDRNGAQNKKIHSCVKRDGRREEVFYKDKTQISNIAIYHSSMKNSLEHIKKPCTRQYSLNKCSHICLPVNEDYRCACPVEMELNYNFKCEEKEESKMITVKSKLFLIRERLYGKHKFHEMSLEGLGLRMAVDTDFDPVTRSVYIADSQSEAIHIIDDQRRVKNLPLPASTKPLAVAVDWLRDNIYWINNHKDEVEVARTSGQFRKIVLSRLSNLLDIALSIEDGYLFVSHAGIFPTINRCNLDGSGCEVIINLQIAKPTSIATFTEGDSKKIFWSDPNYRKIEYSDFDGSNREQILQEIGNPLKLFLSREKLFWTDRQSTTLNWVEMKNFSSIHSLSLDIEEPGRGEWFMNAILKGPKVEKEDICEGKCDQLCFSTRTQMKCSCAEGLKLQEGSKCVPTGCKDNEFQCDDKSCIVGSFRCDYENDCVDGSDERNCTVTCSKEDFSCEDGRQCVGMDDVCDSFHDCKDSSDEDPAKCKSSCNSDSFQCKSKECIPKDWRCDGKTDCKDNSDELECESNSCDGNKFKCLSGLCIRKLWVCDKEEDCPNGEDEEDCPCVLGQFTCGDGECISSEMKCNGSPQCKDGSDEDEKVCPHLVRDSNCPPNQRPCSKGSTQCLHSAEWCNGRRQCPDGEDEKDCSVECRLGDIKCADGSRCILNSWVCNGDSDCKDNSDEQNCTKHDANLDSECRDDEFQCTDGKCINKISLCDTVEDCIFGEDETRECDKCNINNGGCQHICIKDVKKISCKCNAGFYLSPDGTTCHDVDECEDEYLCEHECTNFKGGYSCHCQDGYIPVNGSKCKPENGKHWELVKKEKALLKVLGKESARVFGTTEVLRPEIAFDPLFNQILILDSIKGRILRQKSTTWKVAMTGIENGKGIALDYINRNIYYSEGRIFDHGQNAGEHLYSHIKVCNLDNGLCQKIVEVHNRNISSVAISVQYLKLFYCGNTKDAGHIVALKLDGKKQEFVEKEKVMQCSSIAVHEERLRIYWIDQRLKVIESISFSGYGRHRLNYAKVEQAYGLSIIDHGLAWINGRRLNLVECTLINPKQCKETYFGENLLLGSISPIRKLHVSTPCNATICPKDQICVPYSATAHTCLCPYNIKFDKGSKCLDAGYDIESSLHGSCAHNPCHSGTCQYKSPGKIACVCPENRRGKFCEIAFEIITESNQSGIVAIIIIFILIAFMLCAFIFLYKKHPQKFSNLKFWKKNGLSSRFRFNQSFGILHEENESQPPTPQYRRSKLDQEDSELESVKIDYDADYPGEDTDKLSPDAQAKNFK